MRPMGSGELTPSVRGHEPQELWKTPTPYLFLGFAVMMGLIVVALLVLVCSRRKAAPSGAAAASALVLVPLDREPKVVVIMAGDDVPSFLASAKPLAAFADARAPSARTVTDGAV